MASKGLPLAAWFKFTETQVGRDKLYRLVQYVARYVGARSTGDTQQKYQKLSSALSTSRKLFRLGKPLENLNNIVKALDTADVVLRSATIGRNLFLGLWLLQDMFQWLNTVGFIKVEDIKRLNTNASRAWFIGLLFSVTLDLYKLQVNQAKQAKVRASLSASSSASDQEGPRRDFKTLQTEQRGLLLDLVRDVFDLSIPGSSLEYVKIDTGTVGLLGAVTSCIGIYQNWGK